MKVIKRDGHMVDYCPEKIEQAIQKANMEVEEEDQVSAIQIKNIIKYIEKLGKKRQVERIYDDYRNKHIVSSFDKTTSNKIFILHCRLND